MSFGFESIMQSFGFAIGFYFCIVSGALIGRWVFKKELLKDCYISLATFPILVFVWLLRIPAMAYNLVIEGLVAPMQIIALCVFFLSGALFLAVGSQDLYYFAVCMLLPPVSNIKPSRNSVVRIIFLLFGEFFIVFSVASVLRLAGPLGVGGGGPLRFR